jgi:hypothetical protein
LTDSKREIERLRTQEQESRDDLERTEQELQALSHAYSNLETEYQRSQGGQGGGAPTGEPTRFHPHAGPGPLEAVTLRAENDRLRNDMKAAED